MKIIMTPMELARMRADGSASAQFFGGSSKSSNTSSNSQVYNDSRQAIQNDSHNVSDSGNTNYSTSAVNSGNSQTTVITQDPGALKLAGQLADLTGALSENNIDAVTTLARMGSGIGDSAYELAAQSAANSMAMSTHMLDLAGDFMSTVATGTGSAVAQTSGVAQAMTASATQAASSAAQLQKYMLIGGAVLVVLVLLKR